MPLQFATVRAFLNRPQIPEFWLPSSITGPTGRGFPPMVLTVGRLTARLTVRLGVLPAVPGVRFAHTAKAHAKGPAKEHKGPKEPKEQAPIRKDVLVVGGGAAGLSLLRALEHSPRTQHLDTMLVDPQPLAAKFDGWADRATEFENRVVSLTPASVAHLDDIGAWQHVVSDRTFPYDEMRVWDGESGASIDFDGWSSESGVVATMIENSNLQQALLHVLETPGRVVPAGVESISRTLEGWPLVTLSSGEQVAARLLVGADGQQSPVRHFSGIESRGWDYGRFGVVATLHLEYDNLRSTAFQRFLRTGPLAVLPLPDGRATLVWSTVPERAQWLRQLAPEAVAAMVNAGTRLDMVDIDYLHTMDPSDPQAIIDEVQWRLDARPVEVQDRDDDGSLPVFVESVVPGSVAGFPLKMRHADAYVADRVALVGDAAHTTHPLSGQGLNMGQRDVRALAAALGTAVERGLDIGSLLALEPYPRECYAQNHLILGVNDKLHKLYSTDCAPVVALRSLGLSLVDSLDAVKKFAIAQAQ